VAVRYRGTAAVTLLAVGAAAIIWLRHTPPMPAAPEEVVRELARATIPIVTDDPDADDGDLAPLLPILRSKRIVALGEATHGTREFFRLKDRLLRLLVRRAGFTVFAMEISPEGAEAVRRYVADGTGDPEQALRQFEFWTWKTEEVLALVRWMRAWNVEHAPAPALSFVGINATGANRDRQMAANVERVVETAGSGGRVVVWAHNDHVSTANGRMGSVLRARYAAALYVIGFEFSAGSFRSRSVTAIRTYSVPPAADDYYAGALARLQSSMVFLDFATASRWPRLATWLQEPRRSHAIDELFYLTQIAERWHTQTEPWSALYDGVIFVRTTSAAHSLSDLLAPPTTSH
jgi:erythromycin esterase-like protein